MKKFDYAQRKFNRKKWWIIPIKNYNFYIWALPFVPFVLMVDKFNDWRYYRLVWNEATAKKILDHVLPYYLEWVEEDNAYYYCMEWFPNFKRHAPLFYKKWASKFNYGITEYLKNIYEHEDYIKTIESDRYDTCWIKFEKKA